MAPGISGHRLSRLAEADLEDIYTYTVDHWSVDQANRYIGELQSAIQELVAGSRAGRRFEALEGYFSLPVGSHTIIYREGDTMILVVRILHKAMDAARHLPP
jgi:toxin ParE1/3/4